MDALEVFASSNVTTVLIDSLGRLLQMGQSMQLTVASIDHINAVTNAEGTGDPKTRAIIFQYSNDMKFQISQLQAVVSGIRQNPADPRNVQTLMEVARVVRDKTSMLIAAGEDDAHEKTNQAARDCARSARGLIDSLNKGFDEFYKASQAYAQNALALVKTLQQVARAYAGDQDHQNKIIQACNAIKDMGPQLIRSTKLAFESPGNQELIAQCMTVVRNLAQKIAFAVNVSKPDGRDEQENAAPAAAPVPIPNQDPQANAAGRKKTIADPSHGKDVLRRVRAATLKMEMNDIVNGDQNQGGATPSPAPAAAPAAAPAPPPAAAAPAPAPAAAAPAAQPTHQPTPAHQAAAPAQQQHAPAHQGAQHQPAHQSAHSAPAHAEPVAPPPEPQARSAHDEQLISKLQHAEAEIMALRVANESLEREVAKLQAIVDAVRTAVK